MQPDDDRRKPAWFERLTRPQNPLSKGEPEAAQPPPGRIVMYCTPWCPDCRRARAWLAEHHLEYTEVDISRDRTAARRVESWANGYQTTPTFDIDGTIVVDFDEARLRQVLQERLRKI